VGKIILEDIEFFAFHGHYTEEKQTGGRFLVNLEIDADIEIAGKTDNLDDTFDYQLAYNIVNGEMQVPSALLEHIAGRIIDKLLLSSGRIRSVKVKVSKMNPPFGGNVKAVSIEMFKEKLK